MGEEDSGGVDDSEAPMDEGGREGAKKNNNNNARVSFTSRSRPETQRQRRPCRGLVDIQSLTIGEEEEEEAHSLCSLVSILKDEESEEGSDLGVVGRSSLLVRDQTNVLAKDRHHDLSPNRTLVYMSVNRLGLSRERYRARRRRARRGREGRRWSSSIYSTHRRARSSSILQSKRHSDKDEREWAGVRD